MSQYILYGYDYKTRELQGPRPAQLRPNGEPVLISGSATPTAPSLHKVGFTQVWRGDAETDWPYKGFYQEISAGGDDGIWWYIEDHRQEMDTEGRLIEGTGTPYWLPAPCEEADDWRSEPRYVKELGPLPDGAVLTHPGKPLDEAKNDKRREIVSAHGAVLAFLIVDTPSATPVEAALAVEDMRKDDPDGLTYVRSLADDRRTELLLAVEGANTLAAVDAITVTYPV